MNIKIHEAAVDIIRVFMVPGAGADRDHPEGRYEEVLEAIEIRLTRLLSEGPCNEKIDIDTATREELSDELAAAGEYTMDWEMTDMDDLRERVRRSMK